MLGLRFQDDAADFEAGIDAFMAALGNTASDSAAIRARTGRTSLRRRPGDEHRQADFYEGRSRKVEAKRDRTPGEGAEARAVKRLKTYFGSLATALGFEVAEPV